MAELPSGAVTFVFTDIEGSTQLVRRLRDRYSEVLAEHQRLLREAFSTHGGHEVDTQGDAFFYAFGSAHEAVLAAVEGQRALSGYPWPDEGEVKVRIGVHTGQAAPVNGRYTGLAVHRAARICAAGHGGQILVSQATQSLLEDEEEDLAVGMRDLGDQRLKDIERPVRLYQVSAPGLPVEFPPPRGEAPPTDALEATMAQPLWRRRTVLVGGAAALLALVGVAVFFATRDSNGGLSAVQENHVGLIDPRTNEIVTQLPVGIRPGPIAFGAGAVWVGNLDDRSVTKIDPAKRSVAGTISLEGRTPTGIAVGLGAVWVAHGIRGDLSRVDPQFGRVSRSISVGGTAFGSPNGSVALGGGSVWTVYGDSTLARLDSAGTILERTLAGIQPAGIVFADGSVWVTNSGDATVERFNAASFREGPLGKFNVGRRPNGIASVGGAIWVASSGDDVVTRIDPASGSTLTIPVGDGPSAVVGAAGAVWVANTAAGTISRIDPGTNQVVETIDIGSAPSGLVAADGFLWVTVQAP